MRTKVIKQLVLSLTGDCNYACRYCYAAKHNPAYMTREIACKAVELVAGINQGQPFILQFSGGEPLLNYPVLQAVVEYVEQQGIKAQLQLQTNGSLLTKEIGKYLYLHKVGIGISLDGKIGVNDKLRLVKGGGSATLATLQGLEALKELHIGCGLTCVVTSENVEQLPELVDFAYYLGNIRKIGYDLLRFQGRGSALEPAAEEAMDKAIKQVYAREQQLSKLFGYRISFSQREKACLQGNKGGAEGFSHCSAMTGEAVFVDAEGKLYGCASFVDVEEFYIGNVWEGFEEDKLEALAIRVSEAMSFCRQCDNFAQCGGGCLARWYKNETMDQAYLYKSECAIKLASR